MRAGDVPKFEMQGVEQCWHCKHRDGSGVHHVNGYLFRLPYCKVCDADMTIVHDSPCRGFEAEGGRVMKCPYAYEYDDGRIECIMSWYRCHRRKEEFNRDGRRICYLCENPELEESET